MHALYLCKLSNNKTNVETNVLLYTCHVLYLLNYKGGAGKLINCKVYADLIKMQT